MFVLTPPLAPPEADWSGYPTRTWNGINTVVFHRVNVGKNAAELIAWFKAHGPAEPHLMSPQMPYTFVIPDEPDGTATIIEQAVPLIYRTPHTGGGWNTKGVGVAVIGDFRVAAPSKQQTAACVYLAARLQDFFNRRLAVTTHSVLALPGGGKHIGEPFECPGPFFSRTLTAVREQTGLGGGALFTWMQTNPVTGTPTAGPR